MSGDPDPPSYVLPLAAKVEALASFGISAGDIAGVLGMAEDALRRDYGSELDRGAIKASASVAESLFRKATGDGYEAVTAAIFWLKTRARWTEGQTPWAHGRPTGWSSRHGFPAHIEPRRVCRRRN